MHSQCEAKTLLTLLNLKSHHQNMGHLKYIEVQNLGFLKFGMMNDNYHLVFYFLQQTFLKILNLMNLK